MIALFWCMFPASGLATFDTLDEAVQYVDDFLSRCPSGSVERWS